MFWFIALIVLWILVNSLWRDDVPDPAPDLQPRRPFLTDNSTNGFTYLADIWEKFPEPIPEEVNKASDMVAGGKAWDEEVIHSLKLSGIPFASELDRALVMKEWQIQTTLTAAGVDPARRLAFHRKFKLAAIQTASLFRQREPDQAFYLWNRLLHSAERSFTGSTGLMDGLFSLTFLKLVAQPALDAAILTADLIPAAILLEMQNTLLQVRINPDKISEVLRHEHEFWKKMLWLIKREGPIANARKIRPEGAEYKPLGRFFLKPNRVINSSQKILRNIEPLLMLPVPSPEAGPAGLATRMIGPRSWWEWLNPNRTGLALLRDNKVVYSTLDYSARSTQALLHSSAVCMALKRWQRQHHGDLPELLSQLVPEFLEEVPLDPFDGAPLRWDKGRQLVYSIGSDWKDAPPDFKRSPYGPTRPLGRFSAETTCPGVRLEAISPP